MNQQPIRTRNRHALTWFLLLVTTVLLAIPGWAQSTGFNYQGRLQAGSAPYEGAAEFQFTLWDASSGGVPVAATTPTAVVVQVTNGLFNTSLDFGAAAFPGAARWLQIEVRTNLGAFVTLSPRQSIEPAPYALRALAVQPGGLASGTYDSALTLNNPANVLAGTFSGDGGGLTNLDAANLQGTVPPEALGRAWKLGGNLGTTPGADFLGTTDNQPLELRANNQRVLRLEPTTGAANVVFAPDRNGITAGNVGAAIHAGSGHFIRTNSSAAVIGGGSANVISNAPGGTIAGGSQNLAVGLGPTVGGGFGNQAVRERSTVAGGSGNQASGDSTTIGGGIGNRAANFAATVAGGMANLNNAPNGFIGAGRSNEVSGPAGTVGGGEANRILGTASYATIPGGRDNLAAAEYTLAAGRRASANHPGAFVWADGADADFASSADNQFSVRAGGGARFETAGAGLSVDGLPVLAGSVSSSNLADGSVTSAKIANGTVAAADLDLTTFHTTFWRTGGNLNTIPGTHFLGTLELLPLELRAGGRTALRLEPGNGGPNLLGGTAGNSMASGVGGSVIAGGGGTLINPFPNIIGASHSAIGGGYGNEIGTNIGSVIAGGLSNGNDAYCGAVAGGTENVLQNTADYGAIGGGANHSVTGRYGTVPGGSANQAAGDYSFAAGRHALANHAGAFVWADSSAADFASTIPDQFRIRARGGLEVVGGTGAEALKYSGTRAGSFSTPLALGQNLNTTGNSAPALRLVTSGGVSADGVLSVSSLGTGDLATFGNSSAFVARLSTNGTWTALAFNPTSDRAAKENFQPVDPRAVLEKVAALPLARWNYRAAPGAEHLGPVAQDFHTAFGLNGADDRHIATVDADGVALAAIQGLNAKVEAQRTELAARDRRIGELEARLARLEILLTRE